MGFQLDQFRLTALCGASALALAACGGGGGDSTTTPVTPVATTTNVSTTVIDGAIRNALVCLDKNANGLCDTGEVQGRTDASGNVTLAVPNADVGKYPIIAVVGTDAVDADNGPVTTAYTMTAPADQAAVVSPLTTLVQQTVATTGVTTADAAKSVQDATGITASLFQDFTKLAAPTDGTVNPATVARMVVVTTQQQAAVVAPKLGTPAIDGATITQADLDRAIQKKLLELLPSLVTALSDPAVLAAATPAAQQAALLAAATTLVNTSGLTAAGVATAVAINTQAASPGSPGTATPTGGFSLDTLIFTDASNHYTRTLGSTLAQDTPDANGMVRYVERRRRVNAGSVATWGSGGDPLRNADLSWNGSAWVACPINTENTSTVRDASGNSSYTYCSRETGKSNRVTFDIAGKTMTEVYAQVIAAGYANLNIANTALLGTATFPVNSKLFYQTNTPLTEAISYYPAGANSAPGTSNTVTQYSAAVAAGGIASAQAAGVACNSVEASITGVPTASTTLESMIATKAGTPCVFGQGTFVYNGVTYSSDAPNEWWGNSTASLGKLGNAPVNSGTAPGYYTTNTLLRVAFTGSGTNPVTYYACKERFNNGSVRNCTVIGTGSYTITTLGNARALTLNNPPLQATGLNYNRVFVERAGAIYFGYQSKPIVTNKARLNASAATALLAQLGVPVDDPAVPVALTAGSYQGTWDVRATTNPISATVGTTFFVNGNGSISCQDRENSLFFNCTVAITNPANGAFTFANLVNGNTGSGTLDFMAGSISGTVHDVTSTPAADYAIVGARR